MAGALLYPLILLGLCILGLFAWILYLIFGPSQYDGSPAGSGTGLVSVHVLVLGDIGRSPRMTYHALSVAKHGGKVNLIGYLETSPHPDVVNNPNITLNPIPAPPRKPDSLPFLLFAPWKVLYQVYHLFFLLAYTLEPAQWILVQNPPSIPTLAIASLICQLRNTKLMIDWHNYGWTILASTRGPRHPLVRISKLYECLFGRLGSFHLTVTHAMARQLRRAPYSIKREMLPVHDRPAAIFRPVSSPSARESILQRVLPAEKGLVPRILDGSMRLIVSSTSWTPDEDFSILLDALTRYASAAGGLTPILAVITGKGPQKEMYLERIAELTRAGRLPNVRIVTAFLPFPDYAALLACADLGICLHMSSSGVDLPMKVVDMFGAGLPVAAYSGYESFGELVKEGSNGRGFKTAEELAEILARLLSPEGQTELETLRRGAVREGSRRWDEEWDAKVGVIMGLTT
ncbi:glycosyl transferases group 1-domain-containing protein [Cercophora newfieldiana]|uniref:Chitobiosyldiphosphodolichol beta-mannosyltransferase n=1 Tax=Cercophora newfieldiana TaxID=92897 RepID=A0AA39XZM1_9PEZI|nr:glycosyl transferases group 1-domain-containing protein [Cercophora newfieldiana]